MGVILNKFYKFIVTNLSKNVEVISKSFGSTLIIWVTALIGVLISFVTGEPVSLGTALAMGLTATAQFLIIVIRSIFGKKSKEEEK